ncbi:MAG: hypothetical protein M1812_006608 [Candelaria pacifica]|nr:MAG: hypothetical protein M1812_006608 [Candelaria pacifica]
MTESSATIPSAVVLPEISQSPSPRSKRRQSSVSETNAKRPRLSIDANNGIKADHEQNSPSSATTERRPERRKSGHVEERKRGQRLFGALLGTLSQSSSSNAQKRRTDIERKQQAKLKLQAEEYDEKKKKALDELLVVRRKEGRKYDEQSMRIRHSNMLAMANFLRTDAEPRLYYKPWELLPGDEERIKAQISETEALVDQEVTEFKTKRSQEEAPEEHNSKGDHGGGEVNPTTANGKAPEVPDTVGAEHITQETTNENPTPLNHSPVPAHVQAVSEKENGDDSGEVMLEADEDTVIY